MGGKLGLLAAAVVVAAAGIVPIALAGAESGPEDVASSGLAQAVHYEPTEPAKRPVRAASAELRGPLDSHPLDGMGPLELQRRIREEPATLGSASIGQANRGALWGGVQLTPSEQIEVASPPNSWATTVAVQTITTAVNSVHRAHPDTPKLYVGDLSSKRGGWLRPHRSHQSGLDADIGYYYRDGAMWYVQASADNLDLARTWTLVRALIDSGNVEYIFVDRSVQKLLRAHAEKQGEEPAWLDYLFESPLERDTVIRHTWGHRSHFHVRFSDPVARETARRLYPHLRRYGKL